MFAGSSHGSICNSRSEKVKYSSEREIWRCNGITHLLYGVSHAIGMSCSSYFIEDRKIWYKKKLNGIIMNIE